MSTNLPNGISRSFLELSDTDGAERVSVLAHLGRSYGSGWDDLLTARRILIVSEAGVGKTYECRACQQRLWAKGEPAFFLELATLADTDVEDMLTGDERSRLSAWLLAQAEVATFFLDSIDELKITQRSFGQALTRLGRTVSGHLSRVRVVITTRPIPIDQQLIEQQLPIPLVSKAGATPEAFADVAMQREKKEKDAEAPKLWRRVGLMPLTREQIRSFAIGHGVSDPDALLADIERRHAEEYAQRPQDLIELCSDWNEHKRIRKHSEQVATSAANKLKARTDRPERAALADARAWEGASRLALAALLTRKLTIRYSAEADGAQSAGPSLDAGKVLTDWPQPERDTLLERALFGFANYGRVRFHHRSVIEYLAAKRLDALLERGVPIKAIKRVLFVDTAQGIEVVRPSMRPVAAWLALWRHGIYDEVVRREPEILLVHGDPESLTPVQRSEVLQHYVERYGQGGWRGLSVPAVQIHRFAADDLNSVVQALWRSGIENPEVRDLILDLIGAGRLHRCAGIAYKALIDSSAPQGERLSALDALIGLQDERLPKISSMLETKAAMWPAPLSRSAVLRLFPKYMAARQLCVVLNRAQEPERTVGDVSWRLPQVVDEGDLSREMLNDLRVRLTTLVIDGAEWKENTWPHEQTKRPDLVPSLMAGCNRQFREGVRTSDLIRSSVLALRFTKEEKVDSEPAKSLLKNLLQLPPAEREFGFWTDSAFMETLHPAKDAWQRVYAISHHGGVRLSPQKDREWVLRCLADKTRTPVEREMMLWAAMNYVLRPQEDHLKGLEALKPYVADLPELLSIVEKRMTPDPAAAKEMRRLQEQSRRSQRKREVRDAEAHASWVNFWKEIADKPDEVFKDSSAESTAWNLWQVMERSGRDSRAAGWNRRFIEQQFGAEVADRLRSTLLKMWRKDKPTLRSERPADKKGTFLVRWQLGLAAIYAEAEDWDWARRLTDEQARLASRYAPIQLNGFPSWLDALVSAHPSAVDATLGNEFTLALQEAGTESEATIALQNVSHATPRVKELFCPRVRAWLDNVNKLSVAADSPLLGRVERAVEVLMQSGDASTRKYLETVAKRKLRKPTRQFHEIRMWLPVLMQLDPEAGVIELERILKSVKPDKYSSAVKLFASLFARDHRGATVNLQRPEFTARLLVRLVRQVYKHVRLDDDTQHEGTYSPDERDDAERARGAILKAFLATTGLDGWASKVKMADDPLFADFKDRVLALALERAAEEVDGDPLSESDFVDLDKYGEAPLLTRDGMFEVMRDRLQDMDDLLLRDDSPREAWAQIRDEHIMRRELARELRNHSNNLYTVDQESVTADEKETDIRLRSARSPQQAVVELKIGEKPRSAKDLRKTIKDQLVKKYLAPENCRAGCLLITLASRKTWAHPDKKEKLNFAGLITFLNEEADRLAERLGGSVRLMVKGLDLQPRLLTEKRTKASNKPKSRQRLAKAKRQPRRNRKDRARVKRTR